jgi:N-acetylmuramoyl-L-alanine amidase
MAFLEALLWLSLNVFHESRGEEKLAQIAVAHVTLNRTKTSIKEAVLEPYAFSWTHQKESYFPTDIKAYFESLHSAYVAIQGHDFTGGADHYHSKKVKPKWAKTMTYVGEYGNHKFYKPMIKIKAERRKRHL